MYASGLATMPACTDYEYDDGVIYKYNMLHIRILNIGKQFPH